ncbi:MAG: DUF2142 domain-containing protein [Synergistaceae bacterium]|nr:DUF2142 domain-containing protein [Synergistaceae bacterium]
MRFAAVLFVTLCIFLAIKILPEKSFLIFLIAMMPTFLAESASIAADAVINSVSILVSAYILSLARTDERLKPSQIFILLLSAIIIGLLKQVYGTIMLLYFVIPYKRLGSRKNYITLGIIILLVCLISSLSWLYLGVTRLNAASGFNSGIYINPAEQMKFFAANPLKVFKAIITSYKDVTFFARSFMATLGWLQAPMSLWFCFIYASVVMAGSLFGELKIYFRQRLIMIGGCLATLLAIDFMLYFTWNSPGALICEGMQGRYLIPLAVMGFSAISYFPRLKHEKAIALTAGLVSAAMTIIKTYTYFYRV